MLLTNAIGSANTGHPSVKTLVDRLRITAAQAKELRKLMADAKVSRVLEAADKVMGGYGVEYIASSEDTMRSRDGLEYVNMGDTYTTTLVYDHDGNRYKVVTWGDLVEADERLPRSRQRFSGGGSYNFATMAQIRETNKATGRKFFERDTMRFFDSRVHGQVYGGRYFITSERFHGTLGSDGSRSRKDARRYTVRFAKDNGDITTVGEFGQYGSLAAARTAAKRLAK